MRWFLVSFSFALLLGCPPAQCPVQPEGDAGADCAPEVMEEGARPPADVRAACASLKANGCPAGIDPACEPVLAQAVKAKLSDYRLDCIAVAKSKAQIRNCGGPASKCAP